MKHLTTLIVSLFLSVAPLSMMAQSKVAHINTQQLISEMPEVIAAQNELKKLEDQYAKELETSAKEFQTKAQSYQGDAQNQTDLINQQRQVELQEMQQRIQEFRETAAQELQKRSSEMMRPLSNPDVSLSIRCTKPGLPSLPFISGKFLKWNASAFTSVPLQF